MSGLSFLDALGLRLLELSLRLVQAVTGAVGFSSTPPVRQAVCGCLVFLFSAEKRLFTPNIHVSDLNPNKFSRPVAGLANGMKHNLLREVVDTVHELPALDSSGWPDLPVFWQNLRI